jgi:hypothetical protein
MGIIVKDVSVHAVVVDNPNVIRPVNSTSQNSLELLHDRPGKRMIEEKERGLRGDVIEHVATDDRDIAVVIEPFAGLVRYQLIKLDADDMVPAAQM